MAGAAVQLAQFVAMQDGILAVIQEYLQQREGLLQFHQRGPHLREHDEAVQADAQLPFLPLAPCGGQVLQPLQARDDVQGVEVELPPQVGQHRTAARAAPEQGRVQILLEMPDDLLHGRAAHAQTASGGREGAGLGHGPKIVQAFRGDDHVCLPQTGIPALGQRAGAMPPPVPSGVPAVVPAASFAGRGLFPMSDSRSLQASAPFPSIPCADTQASLSRATPAMMSAMPASRSGCTGSPKSRAPARKVPAAPMPVQTA